jgi:hypothetical protein
VTVGTRSVLYGYHCLLLHWVFVARGWWALYGWRSVVIGRDVTTSLRDPRLWLAFLLHDIGYWGKPNMDGPEGETHPEVGARIMARLFGSVWGDFCLTHSRFYAKKRSLPVSPLCYADKLAFLYYPAWLCCLLVSWTGEVEEYLANKQRLIGLASEVHLSVRAWRDEVCDYVTKWVAEHRDGRADTWTPAA